MMNQVLMAMPASPDSGTVMAPAASTRQTFSPGCTTLGDPKAGGLYSGKSYPNMQFVAGEQITITAVPPARVDTDTTITLRSGVTVVDIASFPGTLEYTIPTSGPYSFDWFADANVTWAISCSSPDPDADVNDFVDNFLA